MSTYSSRHYGTISRSVPSTVSSTSAATGYGLLVELAPTTSSSVVARTPTSNRASSQSVHQVAEHACILIDIQFYKNICDKFNLNYYQLVTTPTSSFEIVNNNNEPDVCIYKASNLGQMAINYKGESFVGTCTCVTSTTSNSSGSQKKLFVTSIISIESLFSQYLFQNNPGYHEFFSNISGTYLLAILERVNLTDSTTTIRRFENNILKERTLFNLFKKILCTGKYIGTVKKFFQIADQFYDLIDFCSPLGTEKEVESRNTTFQSCILIGICVRFQNTVDVDELITILQASKFRDMFGQVIQSKQYKDSTISTMTGPIGKKWFVQRS